MTAVGVIPARMASSRFPGKPLAQIAGRPMLEFCWLGASQSRLLSEVVIATCDEEIAHWARTVDISCVMTSAEHQRATDRVAEAVTRLGDAEHVVLIQGDEPMVTGDMVDAALAPVLTRQAACTNLTKRIESDDELNSANSVKVVFDCQMRALYFSRSPIPSSTHAGPERSDAFKQVCVFGFTRQRLLEFGVLEPTPLEIAESIDMLRYLEHGCSIVMAETERTTYAVDVPEDIEIVERALAAARA
jgi:3-deoxy-manno-octulosonate cytidylyltransferase (CMP-KDO synthetase)